MRIDTMLASACARVCREFYGLTDYPEIIKKPMDLGTIQASAFKSCSSTELSLH